MFFDRYDAGERLASKLMHYKDTDSVVYALPRGGVLVGFEVAKTLSLPLDIVITRKIGHPLNEECAICAVTEEGDIVCDEMGICGLDKSWIETASNIQQAEAKRRRTEYKGDEESIPATGRVAILVDDGITTGLTMKAAIQAVQKQKPSKVVVAVPVAPHDEVVELGQLVDEFVVIKDEQSYKGAVGAYYTHFPEVFDKEVKVALSSIKRMHYEQVPV